MKQLMKVTFTLVLLISVLGAGLHADAAVKPGTLDSVEKKPYEYEFVKDSNEIYNGFTGAKKMVITFDKNINTIGVTDVYVEQVTESGNVPLSLIKSVDPIDNKLTIKFKNLEFVDYKDREDFRLVIKRGKLYFDQVVKYELPFKFYDLTPGFESVFVSTNNASLINERIFKHNEPRNILIQVPPIYITKIETIHRYRGLVDPANKAPNLSSIDVIANEEAKRLKVKLGSKTQYERDLDRSTAGVNGFSMGQAGIDDLTCVENTPSTDNCKEYVLNDDFELTAYSEDGRKLETKNFKIRVNDKEKDYKISDYVKADTKFFGKPVSLYELMLSPVLLDNIMKEIDVRALNDLGVSYSVSPVTTVTNREQLELALANDKLHKINLSGDFDLTNSSASKFEINRNVTISGGKITGDIHLGSGTDQVIRLENTEVIGNLTVNVGDNGTAVLDKVTVSGTTADPHTKILSGGSNSIHLNDFKSTNGIEVSNTKQLRIVTTDSSTNSLVFNYKAQAPVQLEVAKGKVNLKLDEGTTLAESNRFTVVVSDEKKVTVSTELKSSPFFSINEETIQDDETPGITQVKTISPAIGKVAEEQKFTFTNTEVKDYLKGSVLEGETSGEWTIKESSPGWEVIKWLEGFEVSKAEEDGFVKLEKTIDGTVYQVTVQFTVTKL